VEQQYIEPKKIKKWPFYIITGRGDNAGTGYYFYNKFLHQTGGNYIQAQLKDWF